MLKSKNGPSYLHKAFNDKWLTAIIKDCVFVVLLMIIIMISSQYNDVHLNFLIFDKITQFHFSLLKTYVIGINHIKGISGNFISLLSSIVFITVIDTYSDRI